ncbi:MAG: hypothetical protein AB7S54_00950 [Bacteroidales bacterium]
MPALTIVTISAIYVYTGRYICPISGLEVLAFARKWEINVWRMGVGLSRIRDGRGVW